MVQYGEYGVSNARQYNHTRQQPNRNPLEYLHRLNWGRDPSQGRDSREKTRYAALTCGVFISKLNDRDLAKQLILL